MSDVLTGPGSGSTRTPGHPARPATTPAAPSRCASKRCGSCAAAAPC